MHGADSGYQQHCDPGVLDHIGGGLDPLQVAVRTETVIEAGALQAITVGHFDGVDTGLVQRAGDVLNILDRVLVTNRMAAVAQGYVGDIEFLAGVEGHGSVLRRSVATAPCVRR